MPTGRVPLTRTTSSSKRATTVERTEAASPPKELELSPLYGVAMLKIAMELKKADALPLEELMSGVLKKMRLDEKEFRSFLEHNGGLLRTIAQRRGY